MGKIEEMAMTAFREVESLAAGYEGSNEVFVVLTHHHVPEKRTASFMVVSVSISEEKFFEDLFITSLTEERDVKEFLEKVTKKLKQ